MGKNRQIKFLKAQLRQLEEDCVEIVHMHSVNKKFSAEEYDEPWRDARALYKKIEENHWGESYRSLVKCKAKANRHLGIACAEKGDYDEALIFLKRAKEYIEKSSIQYLIPKTYIYTMIYMAKCYIEKHSSVSNINECLDNASVILEAIEKKDKFPYKEAALELSLQKAIAGLDSYGQPRKFDKEKVWAELKSAERIFSELEAQEKKVSEDKEQNKSKKKPYYNEWKIKQRETLNTTKGEHLKKLYFCAKDIVHFFEEQELKEERNRIDNEKSMDQNKVRQKKRERIDELKEIRKELCEEFEKEEYKQEEDKHLDELIDRVKEVRLPILDDQQEVVNLQETAFNRESSQIAEEDRKTGEGQQKKFFWQWEEEISQKTEYIRQQAEVLRDCCMEIAFRIFIRVINDSENNTISLGNCAALLYDYYDDWKHGKKSVEGECYFLRQILERYGTSLKEEIGVDDKKEINANIRSILKKIIKIDANNMYALNILAALSDEGCISGKVEHYPALRQSSLKKRFMLVDDALDQCRVEKWQKIKINLIILHSTIVDFMNVTTVDFEKPEWEDLKVAHYTRLDVIPKLINKSGDSKQRLQNVRHLNDPMEGNLFIGHLKREITKEKSPLISEVLEQYEPEKRNQVRNSVYMGSFSGRLDQLNMWSRYGDKGGGCCFQIDAKDFFDRTSRVSLAELSTNDGPGQYKLEDTKYPLYMVLYLPENLSEDKEEYSVDKLVKNLSESPDEKLEKKIEYAKFRAKKEMDKNSRRWWEKQAEMLKAFIDLKKKVIVILRKIQEDFAEIEIEKAEKMREELCNIIMAILDLARFLFKGENYQDEREYRVIQYASDPQYDKNVQESPRLYVEMEKKFVCEQIRFGPKADFEPYATYVQNIKKDAQEGHYKENWKINICKSKISYR